MAGLSMVEAKAASELAEALYDFLPATFSSVTWPDVARRFDLERFWPGGSKRQSIPILLKDTLQYRRDKFCDLIVAVVQEGLTYRTRKGNPITRNEMLTINELLLKLRFKIPELHDRSFLDGLPMTEEEQAHQPTTPPKHIASNESIENLHRKFLDLFQESNAQKRGYAFEAFLNEFFAAHGLAARGAFRIVGEQIDGSFQWRDATYLVEARWRKEPADASDLLVLRGKAEKSDWTRGLFISINGFSELTSDTLRIGRKANLIAMSGHDLTLILEKHWTLPEALDTKLRHTGESGEAYLPLAQATK